MKTAILVFSLALTALLTPAHAHACGQQSCPTNYCGTIGDPCNPQSQVQCVCSGAGYVCQGQGCVIQPLSFAINGARQALGSEPTFTLATAPPLGHVDLALYLDGSKQAAYVGTFDTTDYGGNATISGAQLTPPLAAWNASTVGYWQALVSVQGQYVQNGGPIAFIVGNPPVSTPALRGPGSVLLGVGMMAAAFFAMARRKRVGAS